MWSYFFGRGIIDPVDDIRASNPPVNPALLDALTKDFVDHNFDLRHLMRTIVELARVPGEHRHQRVERRATTTTSRTPCRGGLTAEQLMDGWRSPRARGRSSRVPPDTNAEQLPDPHIGKDGFLDLFGRPARESSCECERRSDLSLPQALNLVNGKTISDAVADPNGRVAKAVLAGRPTATWSRSCIWRRSARLPTEGGSCEAARSICSGRRRARRGRRTCCGRC